MVELRAGVRRPQRRRSLRPDRAEGAAHRRRLPLRRQGLRPQRDDRGPAGGTPDAPADARSPLPRRRGVGAARGRARVRAASLRPPALGALQLGHDGAAEGDRPRPGRDPARAPEEAPPPPRRARRRPAVLVHDDRLDDVELPRRRPALGSVGRPLRREPGVPGSRDAVGSRRRGGHHVLRHERRLHRRLPEGGRSAARRARPLPPGQRRLDRLAARSRGLRLGARPARRGRLALLHLRRHRRLHGLRRRRSHPPGLPRRAAGAGARREGRGVERGRGVRSWARSASS